MTDNRLADIEAILFAAGEPLNIKAIASALNITNSEAFDLTTALKDSYEKENRGLIITIAQGQAQMATSPHAYESVKNALALNPPHNLSQAALETLAIIAYKQPVTRSEIELLRDVRSSSSLDLLIAKGFVEESGRLELPGRPSTFITSREFLSMMRIKSLEDLPEYEDFRKDLQ